MRFRFLNGLDCPDWLLSEIAGYSKVTAIKFKSLCNTALTHSIDGSQPTENARQLHSLSFLLEHAASARCSPADLQSELHQLGLPAEHATQLIKAYSVKQAALETRLQNNIPKAPSFRVVSHSTVPDSSTVRLEVECSDGSRNELLLQLDQLALLKHELTKASQLLATLE